MVGEPFFQRNRGRHPGSSSGCGGWAALAPGHPGGCLLCRTPCSKDKKKCKEERCCQNDWLPNRYFCVGDPGQGPDLSVSRHTWYNVCK
jgi:hypothetical protein